MDKSPPLYIHHAAQRILRAKTLLFTAGAGIGVDSGLPDFRGDAGFWQAYPPYQRLGVGFMEMANPHHFERDPAFAWGFYGHRRNLYRATVPHEGFKILHRLAREKEYFIYTSNVDNQFTKAGFSAARVLECHGSIEHNQCTQMCAAGVYNAESGDIDIDEQTMRAVSDLPRCPHCSSLARPNILMFGDAYWSPIRALEQEERYREWANNQDPSTTVVIECGAGTHIPTVRYEGERWSARGAHLLRINPRESHVPSDNATAIPHGALEALSAIAKVMDTY